MSKNLERIQKIAKVLGIITKVVYIIIMVSTVLALVGLGLLFASYLFPSMAEAINENSGTTVFQAIGMCLIAVVSCVCGLLVCKMHLNYFVKEQEVGTPFTEEGARAFRALGILNIVAPLVVSIVSSILVTIFDCGDAIHVEASLSLGIAMILLSYVFAYGAELENKETMA